MRSHDIRHSAGRQSLSFASAGLVLMLATPAWAQFTDPPPANDAQSSMANATLAMCPTLGLRRGNVQRGAGEDDLNDFCDALVSGEFADTNSVLQRVNGEEMQNVQAQVTETRNVQVGHIMSRMAAVRSGEATGSAISVADLEVQVDNDVLLGFAGDEQIGDGSGDTLLPAMDWNRLGFFMSGGIRFGDKEETSQSGAFSFDTHGVTAGVDFRVADDLLVGAALGYTSFDVDFETTSASLAGQDLGSEGVTLAAFASYFPLEPFYIDGILTLGWSEYDSKRRLLAMDNTDDAVDVEGIDAIAKGKFDSFFYGLSARAGYETRLIGRLMLTPTLQIDYVKARIDGFSESSSDQRADAISLRFSSQEAESVRSRLGLEARHGFETPIGPVVPALRAAYIHEYLGDDESVRIRYKNDPTSLSEFELPAESRDRHYFELGANLSATTLPYGLSAFIDYATIRGLRNFDVNQVSAGVRKAF